MHHPQSLKLQAFSHALNPADFPKKGILFWDVTTILLNPTAFQYTIDLLAQRYKSMRVDVVAGTWQVQAHRACIDFNCNRSVACHTRPPNFLAAQALRLEA
jgi:hypothetical protein